MKTTLMNLFAVFASLSATYLLFISWHLFGFAAHTISPGYQYSTYLSNGYEWGFLAAFILLSGVLGWALKRIWPVVMGMVLLFPIACGIEIYLDPTSHNLLPFDVISWGFPFWLALLGSYLGKKYRTSKEA